MIFDSILFTDLLFYSLITSETLSNFRFFCAEKPRVTDSVLCI